MSAETLLRAAALMRELAEAATPGVWVTSDVGNTHPDRGMTDVVALQVDSATQPCVVSDCCGYQGGATDADGQHIASWYPAVALAVADLLIEASVDWPEHPAALAVARAYLGESS